MRPASALLLLCCSLLFACGDNSQPAASDGAITADQALLPDAGADQQLADAELPSPDLPGPMANVYKLSPLDDNGQTSEVLLPHLTDPDGYLSGDYADVYNCLNEAGGKSVTLDLMGLTVTGSICKTGRRAQLVPESGYLDILPPQVDTDGSNAFAEVMMYYHINTIHDYYLETFGLTHLNDAPLRAVVNLQGFIDAMGLWAGLPNAMFVPDYEVPALEDIIGSDIFAEQQAIVFGYNNLLPDFGQVNFSFDASVIYHEYTHYAIGGERFGLPAADALGLDPSPVALNEALADYFPSSYLDQSLVGRYALGDQARDLDGDVRCPEHLAGESHNDGEIASSAFWAARQLLGPELLDDVLWQAVLSSSMSTTFEELAQAVLDELKTRAPSSVDAVEQLFTQRGLLSCNRLLPHVDFDTSVDNVTSQGLAGKATAPQLFADGVPGYLQYWIDVAPETQEVIIEYQPLEPDELGLSAIMGDASVALQPGDGPITYSYDTGQAVSTATAVLKGEPVAEGYRLALSGSCIKPGHLVFQFINNRLRPAVLTKVKVTQSAQTPAGPPTFDSCQ